MVIEDIKKFDQLEKSCGNRYLAIKFISKAARKLGKEIKEYHLAESKLIQWVLTGKCPYSKQEFESMRRAKDYDGLDEFLDWVSDEEISSTVRKFYKKSVRNHRLILCTDSEVSNSKQDRINVLLRMIWYSENI